MKDKILTIFVLYPISFLLIVSVLILFGALVYAYDVQHGMYDKKDENKEVSQIVSDSFAE